MFSYKQFQKLIKEKRFDKARVYLEQWLKQEPENERLWQWYAKIAPTAEAKKEAKLRIAQLQEPAKNNKRTTQMLLAALGIILVFVLILGIWVLGSSLLTNSSNSVAELPTAAQLPSLTPTMTATETPSESSSSSSVDASSTDQPELITIRAETTESPGIPTVEAQFMPATPIAATSSVSSTEANEQENTVIDRNISAFPTRDLLAYATQIAAATEEASPISSDDSVTTEPTQDIETEVTSVPTNTPEPSSPEPTQDSSIPQPEISMTVPLNEGFHIGIGTFRVLDAQRPANNRLRDIGVTSIPSPPAGHRWVLVEALLICDNETACALTVPVIRGSSGNIYSVNNQIMLDVRFDGSKVLNGQLWGYLTYAIPQTEGSLLLAVRTDEIFYFELQ